MCRLHKHPWLKDGAELNLTKEVWRHILHWHCPQCLSSRIDCVDTNFDCPARKYDYSPEYRAFLDGMDQRPSARYMRQLFIQGELEDRREAARSAS